MMANRAMNLGLGQKEVEELFISQLGKSRDELSNILSSMDNIVLKGIRWFSGKGYGYENKWLPTVMYNTAITAIERLRAMSSEARAFAKMLESSPNFPRHRLCPDVPEDQLLTKNEVALALGLDISQYITKKQLSTSTNGLLKRKGIERRDHIVSLRELNKIVRDCLPADFPFVPFKKGEGKVKLKWSEALYAGFANMFSTQKSTIYTELAIPTINTLNEDLAPTKKKNRATGKISIGNLSVFQRWGFDDLFLTSHQFRHLLDTMAAVNGMDSQLRAKWAQRSDPKHNRYYDHTTPEEYGADFIEDRENELSTIEQNTGSQILVQIATPRTIQELNTRASLSAHTTEYGMCITSYLSEPCTKYRDCINCNEHVCIKGDDGKCERIRKRLKKEKKLLIKDAKAVEDGVPGAKQWLQRRKLTKDRCKQLLEMLEDPDIDDGALIKLANIEDVTQLDRALESNGKKRLPEIINYKRLMNQQKNMIRDQNLTDSTDNIDDDLFEFIDDMSEEY